MKSLPKLIGFRHLSFCKPGLLGEFFGVEPGSITPFALINDTDGCVNVVLDKKMMEMDLLNYHPLTNNITTAIKPSDLLTFICDNGHNSA